MSRAWAKGSTREWRRLRVAALQRDQGQCQLRVEGVCITTATTVHHVLGRAVSGDNIDHLVAACQPCNAHVGDPARHDPPASCGIVW